MRYPDGGGLTPEARARREDVRLQAEGLFEHGMVSRQIARVLRVSTMSVYQWRRAGRRAATPWHRRGRAGYGCKLDGSQLSELRAVLDLGPAAVG